MYSYLSLDKIVSNLIVYTSYFLIGLLWFYFFNHLGVYSKLLLFNFPYGILVLAILFFGNKVILGLLLAQISLYYLSLNYDFNLPSRDYFVISLLQLICMPVTLHILKRFNYAVGKGVNYKLDKTNIFHVLLISFLSTILIGILIIFYSLFFISKINLFFFTLGCYFGSTILIVSIRLLVNAPYMLKRFFKTI